MSIDDGGLSAREHDEMRDILISGSQRIRPAGSYRAQFVAVGVVLVVVGAVAGGLVSTTLLGERQVGPVSTPDPVPTIESNPAPMTGQGTIAYATYGLEEEIYFFSAGSDPRIVLESDDVTRGQVCPAFSPDGTRLASGQGGYGQQLPKDGALVISDLTAEGDIAASEVIPLDGLRQQPCPIWSPDGQWLAFGVGYTNSPHTWAYGAAPEVWLYGIETGAVRRLEGLTATDLEWAADSSQLYIAAADGLEIYSIADDASRLLDETRGAVALSASPDGATLAVELRRDGPVGLTDHFELLLMRPDGADPRVLVDDYAHNLGIGPVWSPDGNRIVFQGGEGAPLVMRGGETFTDGEKDEVVIVVVGDDDPLGPLGTQTVLAPIQTGEGGDPRNWLPATVSWAPDSAALRVFGWELLAGGGAASSALLTVPVDGTAPTLVWEGPARGPAMSVPLNDFQSWR
ncbi:PD40 domain-containing protein [Microbacterium sp. 2FI]|uniref:PD40 domain-containing protein n=1 Tax=Microbacterium sp. 2FI TaxID=2502193 RepID=UPI0010F72C52|nr:PD40 domain-containing protein [Microbacterium sp. 2FI]